VRGGHGAATRAARESTRVRPPRRRAIGANHDTAHLAGGASPTGTITFRLYGPDDSTCTGKPIFEYSSEVIGDGYYESGSFAPPTAGTYRWVVEYSGDRDNDATATRCGDAKETILFEPAPEPSDPQLSTIASAPGRIGRHHLHRAAGRSIYDSATLAGGSAPTGEITFSLYGPNDAACKTPIFTTSTAVDGNGIYDSEPFVPTEPGVYRWLAVYSGDHGNGAAGPTACDDGNEQTTVTAPADPDLSSSASEAVTIGGAIHDTAHLSGGLDPAGVITFRLYGPGDRTCTTPPVFTSTVTVAGNDDYTSGSFVPTAPGGYRWVVSYSGDANDHPAGPTACGDAAELSIVRPPDIVPAVPSISTTASQPAGAGMPVHDVAHLAGGIDPSGTITFELFGPADPSCAGSPLFVAVSAVAGSGDYSSASLVASQPGTYRWVVAYSGDGVNAGAGPTACGDGAETFSVAAGPGPNLSPGPNVGVAATQNRRAPERGSKPVRRPRPPIVTG
jgi:hypothetical protein